MESWRRRVQAWQARSKRFEKGTGRDPGPEPKPPLEEPDAVAGPYDEFASSLYLRVQYMRDGFGGLDWGAIIGYCRWQGVEASAFDEVARKMVVIEGIRREADTQRRDEEAAVKKSREALRGKA